MRNPKIRVEIICNNSQRIRKKCPIDEDHVIIKKGAKGFGGKEWAPKFTQGCIIYDRGILRGLRQKLVIREGAEEFIDFSKDPVNPASWDKHAAEEYWKGQVIRHSGQVEVRAKVPMIYYFGFMLSIFILIFLLLQRMGVRF